MPRSVQLSDEAYGLLKALKRTNESFSDVVKRLAHERKDPARLRALKPVRADFDVDRFRRQTGDVDRAKLGELFGEGATRGRRR